MDKPKNTIAKELDLIRGNTCEYACKYLEKCYRDNKDPDDAEDDLKRKIAVGLCRKFTDDEAYIQRELTNALPRAAFLELTPEHMTGKLMNES